MKKKLLAIALILAMIFAFTACGGGGGGEEAAEEEASNVLEAENVTIEGVYVNDAYADDDNPSLKMVYVFYDVHPDAENMKLSSLSELRSEANTYQFEKYLTSTSGSYYMSNYHYSKALKDVYTGENGKFVSTFRVPEGDIPGDGILHISNANVPALETIEIKADNITHCNGFEEIAQAADPEGYSKEVELQKDADDETVAKVKDGINGYKWDFYVNDMSMTVDFYEPNNFDFYALGTQTGSGTYTVKNGYVSIKFDSNGQVVDIPWFEGNNGIDLRPQDAYNMT